MSSIRAIVAGHGDFGAGLVSAVEQITGRSDVFLPLSNRGLGGEDIERVLRRELERLNVFVVFTDLPAGSWTRAARRVAHDHPDLVVGAGVSLAVLLDFAFDEDVSPGDAAASAMRKGRDAMITIGGGGITGAD